MSKRAEIETRLRKRRAERVRLARQYLQEYADIEATNGKPSMDRTAWLMVKFGCGQPEAEYLVATVDQKRAPSQKARRP